MDLYAKASKPLTIDGVHFNEEGDKELAHVIIKGMLQEVPPPKVEGRFPETAQAINEKNFYFSQHYNALDGYNDYGGRSKLVYAGVTNKQAIDREFEIEEVMAANRDKLVNALAQGKEYKVDDSNTPPFIDVPTNFPGKGPNGTWVYPDPQDVIKTMKVAPGYKVELVASEKDFPELIAPVQMAWDTKGRMFVCTWPSYPHWKPKDPMHDKVVILSDFGTNGKAGKFEVFLDHLHCPTGLEFFNNGLLLGQAPYLKYFKDTTGGDKPNLEERVLGGLDSADTHHMENSFVLDPGGALYYQEGTFLHSQVESVWGPPARSNNGAVYRYEPRTGKIRNIRRLRIRQSARPRL